MEIRARIEGQGRISGAFQKARDAGARAVGLGVKEATIHLHKVTVQMLSTPGQGPPVIRYDLRREHRPSVPGDPPAVDLGKLRQSIGWRFDDVLGVGIVGTTRDYGLFLEFGSVKTGLLPRPWLTPSVHRATPEMRRLMFGRVQTEIETSLP